MAVAIEKQIIVSMGHLMGRADICEGCDHQRGCTDFPNNPCEEAYRGSYVPCQIIEGGYFSCLGYEQRKRCYLRHIPGTNVYRPTSK